MCLLLQGNLVPPEAVKTAEDQTYEPVKFAHGAPRDACDIDNLPPNFVKTIMLG